MAYLKNPKSTTPPAVLSNNHPDVKAAALRRAELSGKRRRKTTELTVDTATLRRVEAVIERANAARRRKGLKLTNLNDVVSNAVKALAERLTQDPTYITPRPPSCTRCGRKWGLPSPLGKTNRSQLYVGLPLDVARTIEGIAAVYFGSVASRCVDAALIHWLLEEDRPSGWARILDPWASSQSHLHPDMMRAIDAIQRGDALTAMQVLQPFAAGYKAPAGG